MKGYQLFSTRLGAVGLAWSDVGIVVVQLPEVDDAQTVTTLLRRAPGARDLSPPAFVQDAIEQVRNLLLGEPADLETAPLDLTTTPFKRAIYEVARRIPRGQVRTYGALAEEVGSPGAARAVGQAMATNPIPLFIPCHRVVASDGRLCGFSAPGGLVTKKTLLAFEQGTRDLFLP